MRIHLLNTQLANQIAAGEVIERPAAVLKELLENSLDAKASRVEIDIEKGGLQLIRVRDDGIGIHPDDLALALSRHATSKIQTLEDLEHIESLGFRGEALASISSVSRLTLSSCLRGQDNAWKVEAAGREMEPIITATAHPTGSTVEVRELFFNTPARRRFLRTEQTEFGHLEDLFKRMALSRYDVSFILCHNQKLLRQFKPAMADKTQRVASILGSNFMEHAIEVDIETADMRIWGWLTLPSFSRNQTDLQYCYLNGRSIRDKLINHAIRLAYQDTLPPGRYPGFVLYLELDPSTVDVNVHPTKHEVRFHNSRAIHDGLFSNLRRLLSEPSLAPMKSEYPKQKNLLPPLHIEETPAVYEHNTPTILGNALALLHEQYILAQNAEGLIIVNIKTAREQCLFQQWTQNIRTQPLLLPLSMNVEKSLALFVEQQQALLHSLGLDISQLDASKIIIRHIPALLKDINLQLFIPELLSALLLKKEDNLALLAKYSAQYLPAPSSLSEMNALLREIEHRELTQHQPRFWTLLPLSNLEITT